MTGNDEWALSRREASSLFDALERAPWLATDLEVPRRALETLVTAKAEVAVFLRAHSEPT